MGCAGSSEASSGAIRTLDEFGDILTTRLKASRKLKKELGGIVAVTLTIMNESGDELIRISRPSGAPSCSIQGKNVSMKFSQGMLKCGETVLYRAKPKGLFALTGGFARLITFERETAAGTEASGMHLKGDVTCATFADKGRTEYVVFNQMFGSTNEAAQAISRSTVVARAAIKKHVYDQAKLKPVNGKVLLKPADMPFQIAGIAIETELCVPHDAINEAQVDASLAALLFFAALPLIDTSKDEFFEGGGVEDEFAGVADEDLPEGYFRVKNVRGAYGVGM